ncbi:SH3 domain-containing protein [cf. Phormidesmis sp. LEGE 11477]|uniref:SH3 domain-containing protein n=1 Tax=cf. Phormidesmis sp. LEGE 11477 TaxID=1828680 RepID=UPI00187F5FB4|nr:SH3 domain-containing protein [cf. Phormidesmis sp. LEGE 11477]MBE9061452.1 SH3 domain-containing protein [cf. Phormidesmis sp. LEGE 11477]
MVMRNFLLGLSKFILGLILAMLIMTLAGASMLRYFMARNAEPPERPTYTNDLPEPPPEASAPEAEQPSADAAAAPASEPTAPEPEPLAEGTYTAIVTPSVGLILRSGPGTDYDNIGGVGYQESVTVLGEDSGWLNIQLSNGEEGWVKDGNLRQQ